MKVVIFGATGGIGKWVLKHCLEKGYYVTVYIRNPSKLKMTHSRLTVIKGELTDYASVKEAILGSEAVLWCVGIPLKKHYDEMISLEGHKILLRAMHSAGVRRIVDWGTPSIPCVGDKKGFVTVVPGIVASLALTKAKEEMIAVGNLLKNSDLDWTMVRFMMPTNGKFKGSVEVGFGKFMNLAVSREDIAKFMVDQIENKEYICKMPIIGS